MAYLTVLLLAAEPLRNTGKYTMADVLAFRFRQPTVRTVAAISTLVVSLIYILAQMVGAGSLVNLLIPIIDFNTAIIVVGVLMVVYVVFGGMLATTRVQIVKAVLLMSGAVLLSILVLAHYGFSLPALFDAAHKITGSYKEGNATSTRDFTQPGLLYHGRYGALDLISLGVGLIFGTAGLPHILMRFYMTTFLGFGAATLVGKANIGVKDAAGTIVANNNLAAPLLAQQVGGTLFLAFIAAVAFATILAVVAGLTIAASSAFAHDIWLNVVKKGREDEREQVRVAKITALVVGVLAIGVRSLNVAFLVGLAFAVAASANVPAILLTLYWRRFNTTGMVAGMVVGLVSSLVLIALSPSIMSVDAPTVAAKHLIQANPIFPLSNPGIVSVPLGFLAALVGTLVTRDERAESAFPEISVRANTALGAEV